MVPLVRESQFTLQMILIILTQKMKHIQTQGSHKKPGRFLKVKPKSYPASLWSNRCPSSLSLLHWAPSTVQPQTLLFQSTCRTLENLHILLPIEPITCQTGLEALYREISRQVHPCARNNTEHQGRAQSVLPGPRKHMSGLSDLSVGTSFYNPVNCR